MNKITSSLFKQPPKKVSFDESVKKTDAKPKFKSKSLEINDNEEHLFAPEKSNTQLRARSRSLVDDDLKKLLDRTELDSDEELVYQRLKNFIHENNKDTTNEKISNLKIIQNLSNEKLFQYQYRGSMRTVTPEIAPMLKKA